MDKLIMSRKEIEQAKVFERLKNRELTQVAAAKKLRLSPRWVREKLKRFLKHGEAGLIHKKRGRPSLRGVREEIREDILDLARGEWREFGPTFFAEKFKEMRGIKLSSETIRKIMMGDGVWKPRSRRQKHRKRRERRGMIGEMIQLDGSHHLWFENRGSESRLLVFIDDATSRLLWLEFAESESMQAVMTATKHYMLKHGRPGSFYVDFGSVFSVNTNNPEHEKKTQFERACQELAVDVIHATSPQAKGRVERVNGTLQNRLVKEMRLANISSIAAANEFLQKSDYIAKHNARFAVPPAQAGDAHRSLESYNLYNILCTKENRKVQNDFTVVYKNRVFQLLKNQKTIVRPKQPIIVNEHLDGKITLSVCSVALNVAELATRRPQKLTAVQYVNQTNEVAMNTA